MYTMREESDMSIGLGWEKNIRSLGDLHVLFNPCPKHGKNVAKGYGDDYEMIIFLQPTQRWRWRVEEEE